MFEKKDNAKRYLFRWNGLFSAMVFILFLSCENIKKSEYKYYEDKGSIFTTSYTIKYLHSVSLKENIEAKLQEFDDSLNPFKPTSTISKVNANEEVVLDTFFVNVFQRSQEISKLSDGLFDITISPLINAWGFGFKNMDNVNQKTVDSLIQTTGYQKIRLQNNKVIKDREDMNINTSAIAKGYSSDVIAQLLESSGIEHYMVEIGGEVRTKGLNEKGRCWRIAITKPMQKNKPNAQNNQTIIQLCNKSLATSGNYHKYYIKDGRKYAHTIDPRTGYPADNNTLSATVIANDCMSADAFATVFMLADTAEVRQIAEAEGLSYMLILGTKSDDFEIIESSDFKSYIID